MTDITALEPAIDPANKPTFLIDWELTLKCNLDCSYCPSGPDGCHWNAVPHPEKDECFKTIEFMLEYADLYMQYKPRWSKAVVVNVYGGEALHHPNIVEILERLKNRAKEYSDNWPIKITCTTNLLLKQQKLEKVLPLIDEFTVSYHSETTDKQKQQIISNIKYLKEQQHDQKVIVLMHSDHSKWPELMNLIDMCNKNKIRYLVKQLDGSGNSNYNQEQLDWLAEHFGNKTQAKSRQLQNELIATSGLSAETSLEGQGRSCCGGRSMCVNQDLKQNISWVPNNNFHGWSCSVNWFFVYIRQQSKKIYSNKDCKMTFDGQVGPIGDMDNYHELLAQTKEYLESGEMPVIECKRSRCHCGLCAPKSLTRSKFLDIMKKHVKENVFE